jgi:UDP-N-acetylmuramoyl-tripeptide--D-alanyl-D-alanine ligase
MNQSPRSPDLGLWSAGEIHSAIAGSWIVGEPLGWSVQGVSFSLRELRRGDLFFATDPSGWNSSHYPDHNDNLRALFDAGAACVVVSRLPKWLPKQRPVLLVKDTRRALDDLGRAARARLHETTVICVTGSVGKSTTKEILGELLAHEAPTKVSPGNHNHGPGVPLSLAKTPIGTRYGVYEFSVDLPRVTLKKAKIVRPHVAVITNIHPDHLIYYGSMEKVSDQKCLLFDTLEPNGSVVLNRDSGFYERQHALATNRGIQHIYSFGEHPDSSVRLLSAEAGSETTIAYMTIAGEHFSFIVPRPGIHVVHNCLAAVATIMAAKGDWRRAIQNLANLPKRGLRRRNHERIVSTHDGTILLIDDTFSANPASVRSGLEVLRLKKPQGSGRRVAVLADIKELGEASAEVHAALAPVVRAAGVDLLFTFGPDSANIWHGLPGDFPGLHSEDPSEIVAALTKTLRAADIVYIKGSHRSEAFLQVLIDSVVGLGVSGRERTPSEPPASAIIARPITRYQGPIQPLQLQPKERNRLEILFVGDTAFGENYQAALKKAGKPNILEDKGYDFPLAKMRDTLLSADLVIANLETPLTDLESSPFAGQKSYIHWGDIKATPLYLLRHNISAVALANNHCFDYGSRGFDQTLCVLAENNITAFGAGRDLRSAARPLIATATQNERQFSIAVISAFEFNSNTQAKYRPYADSSFGGLCPLDPVVIASSIRETKKKFADAFVVVFPHWGPNYKWRTRRQIELAEQIQSAGADLILGHGAHTIQEIERKASGWIVYSLGNFMFNSPGRYAQHHTLPCSFIAKFVVRWRENTIDNYLRLFPVVTDNKLTGYQTRHADQNEFDQVVKAISRRYEDDFFRDAQIGNENGRKYIELAF